jgi:hypothetical protein
MKRTFELVNYPNQIFSTTTAGNSVEITLRTFRGVIYANVSVNGVLMCAGARCIANKKIFPSRVENAMGATMYFECSTDKLPSYTQFNTPQCMLVIEDL